MAFVTADFVKETTTSTGTGDLVLAGARSPGRAFSTACADNDTFHYSIGHQSSNEWETGLGTFHTGANSFTRTTVFQSSNANAAVNFSAGTKFVDLTLPTLRIGQFANINGLTGVLRSDSGIASVDSDVTDIVAASSETVAGKIEIATSAEVNTGTDNTRCVSPAGLTAWTGDSAIVTVGTLAAGNADAVVSASSTTVSGKIEAATTTEQLTGTDAARAATPDSVAALWEAGADNSDGATITLGEGGVFNLITSTTTITAFAFSTDKAGRRALIRFNTSRQVTHNATSLISPTAGNLLFQAGDQMEIVSLGGGNFRIVSIRKFDAATGEGLGGVTAITANAAATNATTNLSVTGSYTAVANVNRVMSVWRASGYFVFLHTAAATPTLTLEVVVNGSVVDSATMVPETIATTFSGRVYAFVTIRTVGAGGTLQANCWFETDAQVTAGTTSVSGSVSTSTDAIDTTVSRTLELRVRMTTAVASNTLTVTQGFWEKVV